LQVGGGQIDLIVAVQASSAQWNVNSGGSYNTSGDWDVAIPNGQSLVATFGNGAGGNIGTPPASISVTVDGAETVGGLTFNNTHGTQYILANDGNGAHGITLDNAGSGATIIVANGVTTQQQILAGVTLAENTTVNIASGSSLLISSTNASILNESVSGRTLTLTGGGLLTLDKPVGYTGTTRIHGGTLRTTGTGAIGNTAVLDVSSNANSTLQIGNMQTLQSLSITTGGSNGTATAEVSTGGSLTIAPPTSSSTTFAGNVKLDAGLGAGLGGILAKGGDPNSTVLVQGTTTFQTYSALQVTAGTLRISSTGASVGTNVAATVASNATLELDGTTSALTDATTPIQRAAVKNNGTLTIGDGTIHAAQQVGGIDPVSGANGTVQVLNNNSLTADHIVQNALVIGNGGTFTLAPSNANGNPMIDALATTAGPASGSGGLLLAGNLAPSSSMVASSGGLLSAVNSAESLAGVSLGGLGGTSPNAVPEPSTVVIVLFGIGAMIVGRCRSRTA
jgi:hypothetical protein